MQTKEKQALRVRNKKPMYKNNKVVPVRLMKACGEDSSTYS